MSTEKFAVSTLEIEYDVVEESSLSNSINNILEKRLASLEGGIGAVVTASGSAAIATTLLTLLKEGDHIVASDSLYYETYNFLKTTLPTLGITTTFVDSVNPIHFENAFQENTKVFFVESLSSIKLDIIDLKAISTVAKSVKVPLIVDNTNASPYLLNPIQFGADVVIHSLSQYISANGISTGGVIIDAGTFDWANVRFPELKESEFNHGVLKSTAFVAQVRTKTLRDFGTILSPLSAFQIIQGLETLPARIIRHSWNALRLAEWLEIQDEVAWVNYPGLKSGAAYDLVQTYLSEGQGGVLTFGLKESFEAAKLVAKGTRLFSTKLNNGYTKSFILHPASSTHQQLGAGISEDLIQLSVGLENLEALKSDLKVAFENSKSLIS